MNPEILDQFIAGHGGYWDGECAEFPREDWEYEVRNGDTRLGYWEWAAHNKLEIENPNED